MCELNPERAKAIPLTPDGAPAADFHYPHYPKTGLQLSCGVQEYLSALAQLHLSGVSPLVSLILFGSAAKGAFAAETSDVDLIVVLADGASPQGRSRIRDQVSALEIAHGFRLPASRPKSRLEEFAERAAGHAMSCFICTRSDLLSGEAARVFGLLPVEAMFVDRIVLASVIVSATTVWGEELPHCKKGSAGQ